jgi:hypothetical protein
MAQTRTIPPPPTDHCCLSPWITPTAQVWHGATQKPVGGGPPTVLHSVRSVDGRVLLHEPLEYRLPRFELIDTASIDVVLVSNCHTLLALPYLTERTSFSGVVYATEPTLRFGAHLMASMTAHDTEAPRRPSRHGWKVTTLSHLAALTAPTCALGPHSVRTALSRILLCISYAALLNASSRVPTSFFFARPFLGWSSGARCARRSLGPGARRGHVA